jgi:hypothetical protein
MRTSLRLVATGTALLAAVFLFPACSTPSTDPAPVVASPAMSFTCNGERVSTLPVSEFTNATFRAGDSVMAIGGLADTRDSLYVSIQLMHFHGVGTYRFASLEASSDPSYGAVYRQEANRPLSAFNTLHATPGVGGTVVITTFNPLTQELSGTFSFQAKAVAGTSAEGFANITDGHFSIIRFF